MDTVTTYTFFNGFCDGAYVGFQGPDEPSLPVGLSLFGDDGQVVKARRPASEILVDLGPKFNTKEVLDLVDGQFKAHPQVKHTSGIRVQGVLFKDVPYFLSRVLSHQPMQVMLRVWLTAHVSTPWPASDADASISYYLFVRLNGSRKIAINVDGISVHVDGGWPDGQSIADKLFAAAEKVKPARSSTTPSRRSPTQASPICTSCPTRAARRRSSPATRASTSEHHPLSGESTWTRISRAPSNVSSGSTASR